MDKITTKQVVLNRLDKEGKVDNFWAMDNKITNRLAATINRLKADGVEFDEERSGFIEGTKNWAYYLKQ